ncbi:uroporphyrinogen-III synthase [Halobacillus locisalis]|uniref:Uroporphyrinogen-III synthase n=1 Tax=Halobacillus locisalis TaxID=220753 RepID=A0A838CMV2_9BACI|nr:uroporphyrinogen-III synthase [Halobacillus locisalis]MBA2173427.1 uroporphyrinogen-III synthase [Halobacillus locisalis]
MQPFEGRRFLVTRGKSQAGSLIKAIEDHGGEAIHTPLIAFQLNDSWENQEVLRQLHDYSWVFLTSSNGVKFFFALLKQWGVAVPDHVRFAVIGKKTNHALHDYGYEAGFIPSSFKASVMGPEFFKHFPKSEKILYIRGSRSRDVLLKVFQEQRVFFQTVTAYDTLLLKENRNKLVEYINENQLDALTFTSPSTVLAFKAMIDKGKAYELPCFCIGPTTAEQADKEGFTSVFMPDQYTIDDMMKQMTEYFR